MWESIDDHTISLPLLTAKAGGSDRLWRVYVHCATFPVGTTYRMALMDGGSLPETVTAIASTQAQCLYYTAYGAGCLKTKSSETHVSVGKSIGRSNETSPLMQAMADCGSAFNLKMKKGFRQAGFEDAPVAPNVVPNTDDAAAAANHADALAAMKLYPMALQPWKHSGKIVFPAYVQPKLDGVRCVARLLPGGDSVLLESRGGVALGGFDVITSQLLSVYREGGLSPTARVDGELYLHGTDLQEISGVARRVSAPKVVLPGSLSKEDLLFFMFDMFDPATPLAPTSDRLSTLQRAMVRSTGQAGSRLVLVESDLVESMEESDDMFERLTLEGYEGVVYKNQAARYEFSPDREKRSMNFIKRKIQCADEFIIRDFTHGKGKHASCVVFVLETAGGLRFSMVTLGSIEYREELLRRCREDFSAFRGKLATVKYDALSSDGVPLRGQIVEVDRVM